MDAKIDAAQAAQCIFQQVEAEREIATMDGQNAAEATAKSVPEVPIVAYREFDEIRDEFLHGRQIADHQSDQAACTSTWHCESASPCARSSLVTSQAISIAWSAYPCSHLMRARKQRASAF